jgi:undecaprenyl-diphosphatase
VRIAASTLPRRLLAFDVELCRRATRAQARPLGVRFFRAVSRLGDGPFWVGLAVALPLVFGAGALATVARMAAVGVAATVTAKALKTATARARPFLAHPGIPAGARPLDAGSFPSGHTLHAVAFTGVVVPELPATALLLLPISLAVAASRVVLGLHYPSDVAAGAAVGGLLAGLAIGLL